MKNLGVRVGELDEQVRAVEAQLDEHMLWIPNMPHESTPVGRSEEENVIHPVQGELRTFDFEPLPHWDLGPALDVIDFERGVKLSGTRFYLLKAMGARLYRALIAWLLDVHTTQHGYTEIYPPFMVREEAMFGSAQFPKFRDVVYFDTESELYMLPTAEVALTNMLRDEILDEAQLPLYFVAHTPCFRREKMSAGRDVRGIKRVHQFEKVELYKFTTPETGYAELETLTEAAENVCRMLQIPYRRVEIVTGDLGFAAAKKYDIEMWAPGSQEWLEVSSCSNTAEFQARRANIRYRPADGGRPRFVHTLNGSGLGMTRTLIAVLENYQQKDGSVGVPDVMRDVVAECLAVAQAEGVQIPGDVHAAVAKLAGSMPNQYSSTAQDLARGKRTEIDYLNGLIVRSGEAHGIATPANRVLWSLVKLLESN